MVKENTKFWKDIESKSIDEVICDWNINRLFFVVMITVAFQFINLLNKTSYVKLFYVYNVILVMCICFIGVLIFGLLYFKPNLSIKSKHYIHLICWFLFPCILIPFYIKNADMDSLPITLFIVCTTLATLPLLTVKETFIVFTPLIVSNVIILFHFDCNHIFCAYSVISIIAGMLVSLSIHGKAIQLLTELGTLCTYDPLTKVLNKNAGYQRATNMYEMCKRLNQPFAVYMLDIDFFKAYNDTYGHQMGDYILKEISKTISNTFTRKQDIVCRYGGEEFMVCITNKNPEDFNYMAETLLDNIYELRIETANKLVSPYVTLSAGFAVFTEEDKKRNTVLPLDELIHKADQALYKAKANGRNQFYKA